MTSQASVKIGKLTVEGEATGVLDGDLIDNEGDGTTTVVMTRGRRRKPHADVQIGNMELKNGATGFRTGTVARSKGKDTETVIAKQNAEQRGKEESEDKDRARSNTAAGGGPSVKLEDEATAFMSGNKKRAVGENAKLYDTTSRGGNDKDDGEEAKEALKCVTGSIKASGKSVVVQSGDKVEVEGENATGYMVNNIDEYDKLRKAHDDLHGGEL